MINICAVTKCELTLESLVNILDKIQSYLSEEKNIEVNFTAVLSRDMSIEEFLPLLIEKEIHGLIILDCNLMWKGENRDICYSVFHVLDDINNDKGFKNPFILNSCSKTSDLWGQKYDNMFLSKIAYGFGHYHIMDGEKIRLSEEILNAFKIYSEPQVSPSTPQEKEKRNFSNLFGLLKSK